MADFWNIIVQTNTFNFAILVVIIAVVLAKINLPELTEKLKNEIAKAIENARLEKQNAEKELKLAKKTVKNTDKEVEDKLNAAKANAKLLTDQIKNNTNLQIKNINDNIERVLASEEKKLSTKLKQETIQKAIALAKQEIIDKLDDKLHEKFIEKSIEELS